MSDLFGENITEQKLIDRGILSGVISFSMKNITEQNLVSMLYSKFEAIIDFAELCRGERTGEKISMLFNPHRYSTPTKESRSIVEAFRDDKFIQGVSRAVLFKHGKVKELLYQALQLGINGVQYVNEFPPFIAREFCISTGARTILDPCAGWGGRMIGVASVGGFYYGFEPSLKTYNGLLQLGEFLRSFKNGFDFSLENIPFEDASLNNVFDLALTSPPYYDTEIYSNEETNSCNRYKTFSDWENGFYLPMLHKTIRHSKSFIINIGNRRYDLSSLVIEKFSAKEVRSPLSGASGLGRDSSGKESFYIIQ